MVRSPFLFAARAAQAAPKDGTDFLARHTYKYSNQTVSLTIDVSANVTAGSCSFEPGSLSFALLACTSSPLSGPSWASKFPDSKSVSDLAPAFGQDATAFMAAMNHAGITVRMLSTLRPPERAYLMHFSWLMAKRQLSPLKVPNGLNAKLIAVGATYGMIHFRPASKAMNDWSVNGQ
jgi:hypothetical protein